MIFNIYSYFGLLCNVYYLYHTYMLNIVIGKGITIDAIWRQHLYLTNLNHVLFTIYYIWMVFLPQRSKLVREKLRQFLMSLSLLVTIAYWILRMIDVRLVHGRHTPQELGSDYLVFIHGQNHALLLLELVLVKQHTRIQNSLKWFAIFISGYTVLLAIQQFVFDRSPYVFQRSLGVFGFLVFLPAIPILKFIDQQYTLKLLNHFTREQPAQINKTTPKSVSDKLKMN